MQHVRNRVTSFSIVARTGKNAVEQMCSSTSPRGKTRLGEEEHHDDVVLPEAQPESFGIQQFLAVMLEARALEHVETGAELRLNACGRAGSEESPGATATATLRNLAVIGAKRGRVRITSPLQPLSFVRSSSSP